MSKIETRKIIKFGKNSFVLTLPHTWLKKNQLSNKDSLKFIEIGNDLMISASDENKNEIERQKLFLDISEYNDRDIERTIVTSYINGINTIELKSTNLLKQVPKIRERVENIIGLDVIEQTSDKIILKDFLNYNELDPKDLLRKMDNILRAMLIELKQFFKEPTKKRFDIIYSRDYDINKLNYLIYRIVKVGLTNPRYRFQDLDILDLFTLKVRSKSLEEMGNEIRRAARLGLGLKKKECKEDCIKLAEKILDFFPKIMTAMYKNDESKAVKLAQEKIKLKFFFEDTHKKFYEDPSFYRIIDKLLQTINCIGIINRTTYQY